MITPKEITRLDSPSAVKVLWSDGSCQLMGGEDLRRSCPCAECREKRGEINHNKPLESPKKNKLRVINSDLKEATTINRIWLIGNYALGLEFADGHNSGVYTFTYLQSIGVEK